MEITSGSAVLAAESAGAGPDVLLVHAGVTDQRGWATVVDRLSGSHRCLTYDARGYGRTTYEPEDGWSPVDDAVAVLDAYDAERAVVDRRLDGRPDLARPGARPPDRVRALVLIGPAISGAPEPTYEPEVLVLDEEWERAEERGDLATVNRLEARVWLDGPTAPEGRVSGAPRDLFLEMNRIGPGRGRPGGATAEAGRVGPARGDRRTDAGAGRRPRPAVHPERRARHAAETIPGARLVELPGVAHLPHLEGDERTLREIAEFVGPLTAPERRPKGGRPLIGSASLDIL